MHPDPCSDVAAQHDTEPGRKPEPGHTFGDPVPLGPGGDWRRGERLRPADRVLLGEVHHVDGGTALGEELLYGGVRRGAGIAVVQRHRPLG